MRLEEMGREGRHDGQPHAQHLGPRGKQRDITAATVAEGEIRAAGELRGAQPHMQHLRDEGVSAQMREICVKWYLVEDIHSQRR
jgi:hypothetical protein